MKRTLGVPGGTRTGSGHAGLETSKVRPIVPGNADPGGYSTSGGGAAAAADFLVARDGVELFFAAAFVVVVRAGAMAYLLVILHVVADGDRPRFRVAAKRRERTRRRDEQLGCESSPA
jgi:hypothetical protein